MGNKGSKTTSATVSSPDWVSVPKDSFGKNGKFFPDDDDDDQQKKPSITRRSSAGNILLRSFRRKKPKEDNRKQQESIKFYRVSNVDSIAIANDNLTKTISNNEYQFGSLRSRDSNMKTSLSLGRDSNIKTSQSLGRDSNIKTSQSERTPNQPTLPLKTRRSPGSQSNSKTSKYFDILLTFISLVCYYFVLVMFHFSLVCYYFFLAFKYCQCGVGLK